MAELILRDSNWRTQSLDVGLAWGSFETALIDYPPNLLWMSCSSIGDEEMLLNNYNQLHERRTVECAFVVGGRRLIDSKLNGIRFNCRCDCRCLSMKELEQHAEQQYKK
ncbi:MAG: hypothetical protein NXI22_21820 [bacterium]|nr:hypothetical protein [bacterium]